MGGGKFPICHTGVMVEVVRARTRTDWADALRLVRDYADSLAFDLGFQDFDEELETIADVYGAPGGRFLLGQEAGEAVGCVGVRPFDGDVCEMKRLWVIPGQRRTGLGRRLVEAIVGESRDLGYRCMRLDTVKEMTAANTLYASVGFRSIPPYTHNPLPGAQFLERDLA